MNTDQQNQKSYKDMTPEEVIREGRTNSEPTPKEMKSTTPLNGKWGDTEFKN